jgi:hypothetical protein
MIMLSSQPLGARAQFLRAPGLLTSPTPASMVRAALRGAGNRFVRGAQVVSG